MDIKQMATRGWFNTSNDNFRKLGTRLTGMELKDGGTATLLNGVKATQNNMWYIQLDDKTKMVFLSLGFLTTPTNFNEKEAFSVPTSLAPSHVIEGTPNQNSFVGINGAGGGSSFKFWSDGSTGGVGNGMLYLSWLHFDK